MSNLITIERKKRGIFILLFLAIINHIMLIYPNSQNISYLTLILIVVTLYNSSIGLSLWILTISTSGIFETQHNMSTFNTLLIAVTGTLLIKEVINSIKTGALQYKKNIIYFVFMLTLTSVISYIFNLDGTSFASNIALFCFLMILIFTARLCYVDHTAINLFLYAFIIATISALVFSAPEIMSDGFRRLSVAGNVRAMSNIVGYSLFTMLISLIYRNYILSSYSYLSFPFTRGNRMIHIFLISIFAILLIMTGSRGVILAIVISFGVMLFFSMLWKGKIRRINKGYLIFSFLMIIIAISLLVSSLPTETELFERLRPSASLYTGDSYFGNIRWLIWETTIREMNGMQWFFGAGLAQFRNLAIKGGFDYYAHSVFVDTFVSLGFIGFSILFLFLLRISYVVIKNRNILTLGLLSYLIISFFTHGMLLNSFFWVNLAIVCGISYKGL
ncbi:O-antigen ligase [Natronobacillus azotifigens]|uniref:O-antigen ligase family protein n=1 Tax=Natronobacillus azotifigens TaxID=472978 RepID=A0A9J6RCG7_9BACI|nr:O-antigen ligase family protein [Natronobacillus azotifigens]MCZ0702996.1 O-antigen ligase family protein [Natronobacillus azotifigens]